MRALLDATTTTTYRVLNAAVNNINLTLPSVNARNKLFQSIAASAQMMPIVKQQALVLNAFVKRVSLAMANSVSILTNVT